MASSRSHDGRGVAARLVYRTGVARPRGPPVARRGGALRARRRARGARLGAWSSPLSRPARRRSRRSWSRVEGALAWRIPRGAFAARAAPPLGADADGRRRGVARARRPSARAHAHLRARHAPRPDAGEHPRSALPPHEALRGRSQRDQEARRWTRRVSEPLAGKTLGILGLGRDRPGGGAEGGGARADGDRDPARAGARPSRGASPPARGHGEVLGASDFVLLLLPVTPATRDFMDARRLAADAPDGVAPQLRRGASWSSTRTWSTP